MPLVFVNETPETNNWGARLTFSFPFPNSLTVMIFSVIFQEMKKCFLFLLLFFSLSEKLYGFDISGLQPLAPHGVFSTFSAESLPKHKYSLELLAERSGDPDFYRFSFKAAYGISDKIELDLTAPYVYDYEHTQDGLEDIAFGLKYRFHDEGKYGPSFAGLLQVSVPSGDNEFSTDGRIGAGLIISKRIGPFKGHLNLLYAIPGDAGLQDEIAFLGGVELAAAHNFEMLCELVVRKGHDTNEYTQIEPRFGYRIKTTDSLSTTFGVGLDVKDRSPEYRLFFSVNFTPLFEKKTMRTLTEEE